MYYEILPNLYLSASEGSSNFDSIRGQKINVILNCTKDLPNPAIEIQEYLKENTYSIQYYRISVDDNGDPKEIDAFYHYALEMVPIIRNELVSGKCVLVHCLAGNQRSASFVTALLMYLKHIPLKDAIENVLSKKPNAFYFGSRVNFSNALIRLETAFLTPLSKDSYVV